MLFRSIVLEHSQTRVKTTKPTITSTVEIIIKIIKSICLSKEPNNKQNNNKRTLNFSKIIKQFKKRLKDKKNLKTIVVNRIKYRVTNII